MPRGVAGDDAVRGRGGAAKGRGDARGREATEAARPAGRGPRAASRGGVIAEARGVAPPPSEVILTGARPAARLTAPTRKVQAITPAVA